MLVAWANLLDVQSKKMCGYGAVHPSLWRLEAVNEEIAEALFDMDVFDQVGIDAEMLALDGTSNKSSSARTRFWVSA